MKETNNTPRAPFPGGSPSNPPAPPPSTERARKYLTFFRSTHPPMRRGGGTKSIIVGQAGTVSFVVEHYERRGELLQRDKFPMNGR